MMIPGKRMQGSACETQQHDRNAKGKATELRRR